MSKEVKANTAEAENGAKEFKAAQLVKEPVAYMGPTIRGVAANGTIYTDKAPEALTKKIAEVPAIKGLLIPVSNLAASSVAIQTEGTALNTLYRTVAEKLQ